MIIVIYFSIHQLKETHQIGFAADIGGLKKEIIWKAIKMAEQMNKALL